MSEHQTTLDYFPDRPETTTSRIALAATASSPFAKTTYTSRAWIKPRNAWAGINESRWAQAHPGALNNFRGQWVAIIGDRVISAGDSAKHVFDYATATGYADTLILKVPETADNGARYRIAKS